ncbi:DUF2460 domain-containing protein [Sphingomonas sp.]|uniref:DUF2460 domain-containing protein n=1 Tax=Sphingomonas sp. TaxID=28214 RepID=UPI001E106C9A|nr:DUF2460 domain-containing protein [Sphingomonas sp.]MBX9796089.1 DUF2460 domain-containing protein [Sphingomonas sp.]
MGYWLARARSGQAAGYITRFDPVYWTVNFPRPMMASVVTTAPDALRVDAVFYRADDLAGLIWAAEDRHDHPLLAYETVRDFRDVRLRFRWRSGGIMPLDAVNGPVLTIEGRDAGGAPRAWYVRLWNYARGHPEDAVVTLDFARLDGGFLLPGEADPVFAGDVDRMFISLVPPGYSGADAVLAAPAEGWVELSEIVVDGPGAVLAIGDVVLPEHGLAIASGYDDSYHLTPERLLRAALRLGYRGAINHYVGMSHYFRLEPHSGGLYVSLAGGALCTPCAAWHREFAARARALGYEIIWSLSYELFDAHCWGDWKQRDADGAPALTGWVPPSTLLSPAHPGAMAYLQAVARAFLAIAVAAGQRPRFQVGEPWWWVTADGRPCLYDARAREALGNPPPVNLIGPQPPAVIALLEAAGALLAQSTAALAAAARDEAPGCETLLLAYLPSLLDRAQPETYRMNMPAGWAAPAFDILQLEDYTWVQAGDLTQSAAGIARATARLGYPAARQHYLAGFVLRPDQSAQWRFIHDAAEAARAGGGPTFIWALPQVLRDGYVHFSEGDEAVAPFDDVLFPLALGREVEVSPAFATAIVTSAGGHEARNAGWQGARTRYDVWPGVRSEADIAALLAFFRARLGPARGFRLRDPFDAASADPVTPLDQRLGAGDGTRRRFALVKHYGDQARRITRPVAGSVRVAVAGVETAAFTLAPLGQLVLDAPPPPGALVTAGFAFDVPVRFAEDRLSVARATFLAGAAPSVPLLELREDD